MGRPILWFLIGAVFATVFWVVIIATGQTQLINELLMAR
jgi:hypothetical protein